MKVVWTIVALLLVGGLFVLFQPPRQEQPLWKQAMEEPASVQREPERTTEPPIPPTKTAGTSVFDEPAPSGAASASPAAPSTATAAGTKSDSKPEPSAEPKRPSAEAIAAGSTFEPEIPDIPEAELLPSRFVKLADGSISVDDAWTIRGEGTTDEPYEISWEFLASAQEDYMPRLGERKLPARIAFLSGKHVKISGYLAFPLVAPTSSECLLMLNQWDGCCIGVPPTPYDAVEVRLTSEVKGWKKHTINFGAIEGVFRVEPYLVENWLVGLYLIDEGVLDTEI